MEPSFITRLYQNGDEAEIVELLYRVFDGWPKFDLDYRPVDHFLWKFYTHEPSPSMISLTTKENQIIGMSSNVFHNIKIGAHVYLASKGTDMAVHPDFRRMGVAWKTMELRMKLREDVDFGLMWSFTSNPILIKAWLKRGRIPFPKKIIQLERIIDIDRRLMRSKKKFKIIYKAGFHALMLKRKIQNGLQQKTQEKETPCGFKLSPISAFDERINQFWENIKDEYDFISVRDKEHLNWRYRDPRGGNYIVKVAEEDKAIVGYYVLRVNRYDPELFQAFIVDFLTLRDRIDVASVMLRDIIALIDEMNINTLSYWTVQDHAYASLFKRHGFIETENPLFIDLVNMDTGENWDIFMKADGHRLMFQYGDTDWI